MCEVGGCRTARIRHPSEWRWRDPRAAARCGNRCASSCQPAVMQPLLACVLLSSTWTLRRRTCRRVVRMQHEQSKVWQLLDAGHSLDAVIATASQDRAVAIVDMIETQPEVLTSNDRTRSPPGSGRAYLASRYSAGLARNQPSSRGCDGGGSWWARRWRIPGPSGCRAALR